MKIATFQTEAFFADHEFSAPHLLCASDVEPLSVRELLELADVPLSAVGDVALGYTETTGGLALREVIASEYRGVTAPDVVFLGAPIEGIFVAAQALLEPGDRVIVPSPAYDALAHVAEHLVGEDHVDRWLVQPTETGWAIDLDELEGLVTKNTKAIFVNFPHNATGYLPTEGEWLRLVEIAAFHDLWIFSDEMYRGLELNREPVPSMTEVYDKSVVLAGLSKGYGLAGLRAGWLVVRDKELRRAIVNWKFYTTICATQTGEFLAETALGIREKLLARSLDIIRANLEAARPFFENNRDTFTFREPLAGSVALVEIDGPATKRCREWLETTGVLLLPGPFLGAPDTFVRFGFGRTDFAVCLKALT